MIPRHNFPHDLLGWAYTGNAHAFACTVDACAPDRKGARVDEVFATSIMCLDAPEFLPAFSLGRSDFRFGSFPHIVARAD